jgi:outer membrane protein assembly factor BamB
MKSVFQSMSNLGDVALAVCLGAMLALCSCAETIRVPLRRDWTSIRGCPPNFRSVEGETPTALDIRWKTRIGMQGKLNNVVAVGELVFAGSAGNTSGKPDDEDGVYAVEASAGKIRWHFRTDGDCNGISYDRKTVYAVSDDGNLYAIDAEDGRLNWKFFSGAPLTTFPLAAAWHIFVGGKEGTVYAVSCWDGKLRWQSNTPASILPVMEYSDGRIFFGNTLGAFFCLHYLSGREIWRNESVSQTAGVPVACITGSASSMVLGSDVLNIALNADRTALVRLDARSGKPLRGSSAEMPRVAVIVGGAVVTAGRDGVIRAVLSANAEKIDEIETGDSFMAVSAFKDGMFCVGGTGGFLYGVECSVRRPIRIRRILGIDGNEYQTGEDRQQ